MPANASQVEVQAPPGLENVSGCQLPNQMMPMSSGFASGAGSHMPAAEQEPARQGVHSHEISEEELKQELVREVTDAVREHIDWKTTAAVDSLWQRGQRAMQHLQTQQTSQTEQLRGQLAACAESYRNLERENAALRSGLEALMKHLTLIFGAPPHVQPQSPHLPPQPQSPYSQAQASPQAAGYMPEPPAVAPPPQPRSLVATPRATEDFHTPAASPQQHVVGVEELLAGSRPATPQLPHVPGFPAVAAAAPATPAASAALVPPADAAADVAASSGGTGSEPTLPPAPPTLQPAATEAAAPAVGAAASGSEPQAPSFTLTLRRADNVPLGLELLRGDPDATFLTVEAVLPGGAIEAWNRQCAGDMREIRAGDRIIMINGAEDADSMREECRTKHLLRMTVLRGTGPAAEQRPASAPQPAPELTASGLRADADEFVPQVGSWAALAPASSATSG